jgi:hypothetical protein
MLANPVLTKKKEKKKKPCSACVPQADKWKMEAEWPCQWNPGLDLCRAGAAQGLFCYSVSQWPVGLGE